MSECWNSETIESDNNNLIAYTADTESCYFEHERIFLREVDGWFSSFQNNVFRELGEQEALKKMNINKLENSDTRTKMMQEELDGSK